MLSFTNHNIKNVIFYKPFSGLRFSSLLEASQMVKLQFLASQMVLEGPPRWPGVAIETPSLHFVNKMDKAGGSMATPSLARDGHRTPTQANRCMFCKNLYLSTIRRGF